MNLSQQPDQRTLGTAPAAAWNRRRRAAWIDYLRTTQSVSTGEYPHAEDNAWEQLQRRLRRNDELLAASQREV